MSYLEELNNAFQSVCKCINDSILKTENNLNYKFSDDEKNLCIGLSLIYLYAKYGK